MKRQLLPMKPHCHGLTEAPLGSHIPSRFLLYRLIITSQWRVSYAFQSWKLSSILR